jgi:aspartate beta-hydroxylase
MGTYPDLDNSRWFDPDRFPICSELENNLATINAEIETLPGGAYYPDSETESTPRSGDWTILPIYVMGHKDSTNAQLLPTATAIAENFGAMTTLTGAVFVSRLHPGTSVAAHRGPTNTRLRCHLGIRIPAGDTGIEVDGETRRWQQGRCLVFNDHPVHKVWNRTDEDRVVLIVDIWHPDLTATEKILLTGLHKYADVQYRAIASWHEANSRARSLASPSKGDDVDSS